LGRARWCSPGGYSGPGAAGDRASGAATVLRDRRTAAQAEIVAHAGAAYAAGLLALREGPCLEAAVRALGVRPEVLLVDGTGRDHPHRAGLAIHLGAVLDLPTGVTHRPLLASGPWPEDRQGASSPLLLDGDLVRMWLRTRAGARPLAVYAGLGRITVFSSDPIIRIPHPG
jgi:deoxyribonuclease V